MFPTNTENPPLKVVLKIFRNLPNSFQKTCRHEEEDGSTHKALAPSKLIGKEQLHILLVLLFFNVYSSLKEIILTDMHRGAVTIYFLYRY